ncbi:M55 family metallopeptidase [Eubacteriales bacterium OttesenSCG-928-G02]|nr:M55 family metallopeptidase [Eubacteriales bacterium OttesenSCG-928-G02]
MGKYYISVDLEGVACVIGAPGKGLADSYDYKFACEQGTREALAVIRGLGENNEIIVWDSHGTGYNLNYRSFPENVKFVLGGGSRKRFPGIDSSFDGVIFIGYHAYDTQKATLAHVYSSATFQHYKINDKMVGEMQIDAAIAGKNGVPVIFVASDNTCVSQAKESFGDIETCITKEALTWNSCISKHPSLVEREIEEGVRRAVTNNKKYSPYTIPEPFDLEVRYKRIEYALGSAYHDIENKPFDFIDAYTRKGTMAKIEQIFEF